MEGKQLNLKEGSERGKKASKWIHDWRRESGKTIIEIRKSSKRELGRKVSYLLKAVDFRSSLFAEQLG